jgi:hypothetical protein
MQVLIGILIGVVLAGVVSLVIFKVEERFVKRVTDGVQTFSESAHKDIADYKDGMAGALQATAKQLGDLIVGMKKDVEILKLRVGGPFVTPPKPVVDAGPQGPGKILEMPQKPGEAAPQ